MREASPAQDIHGQPVVPIGEEPVESTMKEMKDPLRKTSVFLQKNEVEQRHILADMLTVKLSSMVRNDGIKKEIGISERRTVKIPIVAGVDVSHESHESTLSTLKSDRTFQLEEFDTIPMMILKDIASRQDDQVPVMQSEISGAASGAAIVGAGNILGSILKFGSNYLLQIGFGATLYGLYSVCLSIVILVSSLCNLGLSDTTLRYTAIYRSKGQSGPLNGLLVFSTIVSGIMGTLGACCVLFLAFVFAATKHEPRLVPLMQLMAPLVPLLSLQTVWFSSLQGLKLFQWRVLCERILAPIVLLLLAMLCFFIAPNMFAIGRATIISVLVSTCMGAYFLYKAIAPSMRNASRSYEVCEWSRFATFNFLTSITEVILESIDTLLLVVLAVTDLQIGQYNAAIKISDFIAMPLFSLNTMFAPTIAELYSRNETQKLGIMYQVVNKWIITLSLPLFFVVSLFCRPLLQLSGASFTGAWPLLLVSAIGSIINAATGSVGYILLMTGHQRISFLNSVISVMLNIVLGIVLIPRLGAMGTALGTTITLLLVNLIRFVEVRTVLNLHPYNRDIIKPIGASCLSALLIESTSLLFDTVSLFIHVLMICVFMLSYGGFLFLFGVSAEDALVLDAFKKKFFRKKK